MFTVTGKELAVTIVSWTCFVAGRLHDSYLSSSVSVWDGIDPLITVNRRWMPFGLLGSPIVEEGLPY